MVRNRRRRRIAPFATPQQRMWLEIAGQRRLRRLHQRLQARREVLRRWSTLLDDVDRDVSRRLKELGGDGAGYDTDSDDVNEPARKRSHYYKDARRGRRDDDYLFASRARGRAARDEDLEDEDFDDEDFEDEEDKAMAKPAVETYYEDGVWRSRRQGSSRAFSAGGTKAQQVAKGRTAARKDKTEHIIKNRDGSISERNSYGGDPAPPYDS